MLERLPNPRNLPSRVKAVGAVALSAFSLAVGLQVSHNLAHSSDKPEVELTDPVTWVSGPISNAIEAVDGGDGQHTKIHTVALPSERNLPPQTGHTPDGQLVKPIEPQQK